MRAAHCSLTCSHLGGGLVRSPDSWLASSYRPWFGPGAVYAGALATGARAGAGAGARAGGGVRSERLRLCAAERIMRESAATAAAEIAA
eukprot:400461-Prymnesium_polylepis.1